MDPALKAAMQVKPPARPKTGKKAKKHRRKKRALVTP